MISLILIDDYELMRTGIARLLDDDPDCGVVAAVGSCEEAIRLSRNQCPDVILINVNAPSINILDGANRLLRQCQDTRIILITSDVDLLIPGRLLQAGVAGYLTQHCSIDELRQAIRVVHGGKRYIADALARQIAAQRLSRENGSPFERLSHRELQILLLLTQGKKINEISGKLYLSPKTVNTYRHRLLDKLGVRTEVELTRLALRHGVIDLHTIQ
jgi:two-component system invasion response regulator UvrY